MILLLLLLLLFVCLFVYNVHIKGKVLAPANFIFNGGGSGGGCMVIIFCEFECMPTNTKYRHVSTLLVISVPDNTVNQVKLIKQSWVLHLNLTDNQVNLSTSKWGLLLQSTVRR